jgi:hypothetical protein
VNHAIFQIQLRSIAGAVQHLHLLDLAELAESAKQYGTPEDQAFIDAVAKALKTLPPGH